MDFSVFEEHESCVRSYCRKFPAVLKSSKGAIIKDVDGKEYIDFFCGAGALNYGHNPDEIKKKLIEYIEGDGILHALDMYTEAKGNFISKFQKDILEPRGLGDYKIMFPGPTGTNAVEAALKLARKAKKRNTVVGLMGAFHGMTLGALALTCDKESRLGAGVMLNDVLHIPAPYMFPELDTVKYLETLITDDHSGTPKPAAVILETTQAEGGIEVFPVDYLKRMRELCDKYDMLLIIDDIQIGCGRTGTFFSFERAGIKPDIFVLSKSIGGCGLPMSLTIYKPELDIWSPGEHNGTFRGNQLAFVAATAAVDMYNGMKLDEKVKAGEKIISDFLENEIKPLDSRIEVRGIGYIWGIDFSALGEDVTPKVIHECFDRGLIAESAGRKNAVLKLMPALITDEETLKKGLNIVKESVKATLGK